MDNTNLPPFLPLDGLELPELDQETADELEESGEIKMVGELSFEEKIEELRCRGNVLLHGDRLEEAISTYSEAIELFKLDERLYMNRATAKILLKRFEEAIPDADKALEINPEYCKAYHRAYEVILEGLSVDSTFSQLISLQNDCLELISKWFVHQMSLREVFRFTTVQSAMVTNIMDRVLSGFFNDECPEAFFEWFCKASISDRADLWVKTLAVLNHRIDPIIHERKTHGFVKKMVATFLFVKEGNYIKPAVEFLEPLILHKPFIFVQMVHALQEVVKQRQKNRPRYVFKDLLGVKIKADGARPFLHYVGSAYSQFYSERMENNSIEGLSYLVAIIYISTVFLCMLVNYKSPFFTKSIVELFQRVTSRKWHFHVRKNHCRICPVVGANSKEYMLKMKESEVLELVKSLRREDGSSSYISFTELIQHLTKLSRASNGHGIILADEHICELCIRMIESPDVKGAYQAALTALGNAFGIMHNRPEPATENEVVGMERVARSVSDILEKYYHLAPELVENELFARCFANLLLYDDSHCIGFMVVLEHLVTLLKDREMPRMLPSHYRLLIAFCSASDVSVTRHCCELGLVRILQNRLATAKLQTYRYLTCAYHNLQDSVSREINRSKSYRMHPNLGMSIEEQHRIGTTPIPTFEEWDIATFSKNVLQDCVMSPLQVGGIVHFYRGFKIDHEENPEFHFYSYSVCIFTDELRHASVESSMFADRRRILQKKKFPKGCLCVVKKEVMAHILSLSINRTKRTISAKEKIIHNALHKNLGTKMPLQCVSILDYLRQEYNHDDQRPPGHMHNFNEFRRILSTRPFRDFFFNYGDLFVCGLHPPSFRGWEHEISLKSCDFIVEMCGGMVQSFTRYYRILRCVIVFYACFARLRGADDLSRELWWSFVEFEKGHNIICIPAVCALMDKSCHVKRDVILDDPPLYEAIYENFGLRGVITVMFERGRRYLSTYDHPRELYRASLVRGLSDMLVDINRKTKPCPHSQAIMFYIENYIFKIKDEQYDKFALTMAVQTQIHLLDYVLQKKWGILKAEGPKKLPLMRPFLKQRLKPKYNRMVIEGFRKDCMYCGRYGRNLCSGCQSIYYCSKQCQKLDWGYHKQNCLKLNSAGDVVENKKE